ncbi:MAG: hypothetical protein AAGI53_13240 [Planctomycetota bacterium]
MSAAAPADAGLLPAFPPTRANTRGRQVELIRDRVEPVDWLVTRDPPVEGSGRLWEGGAFIGGDIAASDPGRDPRQGRFGARGDDRRVPVRVGGTVLSLDPFIPLRQNGLRRLEAARREWLRARGYTGGVRTFVNPRNAYAAEAEAPVAVFRAPANRRPTPEGDTSDRGLLADRS